MRVSKWLQIYHLIFDVFILASTTKKYSNVQNYAAQLSQHHSFDVQFLSWTDIEQCIHKYQEIRQSYYPHLALPESFNSKKREYSPKYQQ